LPKDPARRAGCNPVAAQRCKAAARSHDKVALVQRAPMQRNHLRPHRRRSRSNALCRKAPHQSAMFPAHPAQCEAIKQGSSEQGFQTRFNVGRSARGAVPTRRHCSRTSR
jgi:hypothetical protein